MFSINDWIGNLSRDGKGMQIQIWPASQILLFFPNIDNSRQSLMLSYRGQSDIFELAMRGFSREYGSFSGGDQSPKVTTAESKSGVQQIKVAGPGLEIDDAAGSTKKVEADQEQNLYFDFQTEADDRGQRTEQWWRTFNDAGLF